MPLGSQRWRPRYSVKVLLLVTTLCAVALMAYLKRPPSRAVGILMIRTTPRVVVGPTTCDERLSDRYRATQIALITSPAVLSRVLARPEVAVVPSIRGQHDPLGYLQSKLAVTPIVDSDLAEASLSEHTDDPTQLVRILNAVLAEYLDLLSEYERRDSAIMLPLVEEERLRLTLNIEHFEDELNRLEAEEQTPELKKDIRQIKRVLALQEEFLRTIERRKWVLMTNQSGPSRVTLISPARLATDGTSAHWWDSWLSW